MSESARLTLLALILAAGAASRGVAQDLPELQRRLAIARAQQPTDSASVARQQRVRAASSGIPVQQAKSRAAPLRRSSDAGTVIVALPTASQEDVDSVATAVTNIVRAYGGLDPSRLSAFALVDREVLIMYTLSAEDETALHGRIIVPLVRQYDFGESSPRRGEWLRNTIDQALSVVGALLRPESLLMWTGPLELRWDSSQRNASVLESLIGVKSVRSAECLAGDGAACAAFLGINEGPDAVRRRFPSADVLSWGRLYGSRDQARSSQCLSQDERACFEILERFGPPGTSTESDRESLLWYMRGRFGTAALRRILADTGSSMGARLRRATGATPESIAAGWRRWVFSTAAWEPVHAGVLDAIPVLVLAGLLLTLATRSGRWRA